jgi:hypothetical protein
MKRCFYIITGLALFFSCSIENAEKSPSGYPLQEVPYYQVKVTGGLWKMRIDSCITNTIWDNFEKLESSGKIDNFSISAGLIEGISEAMKQVIQMSIRPYRVHVTH